MRMEIIRDQEFGGERPLYNRHGLYLENVTIHPGESSIKEGSDIEAHHCRFEGKYVFWCCERFLRGERPLFAMAQPRDGVAGLPPGGAEDVPGERRHQAPPRRDAARP